MGPQQKYTEEEKNILRVTFWFQLSWGGCMGNIIKRLLLLIWSFLDDLKTFKSAIEAPVTDKL